MEVTGMFLTSQELGRRIAEARRAAHMTQEKLAEKLGIDRSAMTKIEKGSRRVDSLELLAISEATGSPVESLLEQEQPLALILRSQEEASSPQVREQLKWVREFISNYTFLKEITPNE